MLMHALKEITLLDHKNVYDVKSHHHNYFEIVYYISGKGEIIIDDKKYPFFDNSVSITRPGYYHREYSFSKVKLIYLGFFIENVELAKELSNGVYKCPHNLHILQEIKEILFIKNNGDFLLDEIIDSHLYLLVKMLNALIYNKNAQSRKLVEIKDYIDANVKKKINAEIVVKNFNYDYDYLRKLFKQFYHISLSEYIINAKLEVAMETLKKTNLSINQISESLSFSSTSHFIKLFKKNFKITPKQFLLNYDKNASKRKK